MIAPEYAHLRSCCYSEARKYIELCERDDDETSIMSLNAFQALLFIIRYELTKKALCSRVDDSRPCCYACSNPQPAPHR